jgi:hypothetical protein
LRARDDVPAPGRPLVEPSAFEDVAFEDEPIESALPHTDPLPDAVPPPGASRTASGGIAYITVTDAAGRVLFRRAATSREVEDALRSADTADAEGEAAMDRIAYERLLSEINSTTGVAPIDEPLFKGDTP